MIHPRSMVFVLLCFSALGISSASAEGTLENELKRAQDAVVDVSNRYPGWISEVAVSKIRDLENSRDFHLSFGREFGPAPESFRTCAQFARGAGIVLDSRCWSKLNPGTRWILLAHELLGWAGEKDYDYRFSALILLDAVPFVKNEGPTFDQTAMTFYRSAGGGGASGVHGGGDLTGILVKAAILREGLSAPVSATFFARIFTLETAVLSPARVGLDGYPLELAFLPFAPTSDERSKWNESGYVLSRFGSHPTLVLDFSRFDAESASSAEEFFDRAEVRSLVNQTTRILRAE
jgi:hypothetical protein